MEATTQHIERIYKGITVKSYIGNHGSRSHIFMLPNGQSCNLGDWSYAKKRINKFLKEGK